MKIVVIETRRDHYETLGYFFYLKHRMPNIKVVIYAHDPDNTWLKFYNKEIASLDILNIDEISEGSAMTPLEADIAFINSIDVSWDGTGKESIDYHVNYVARSNNFDRVYLQLHMGNNENANKFRNLDVEFVSPFPNQGCTRLIMPYSIAHKKGTNLPKKLRLTIVGGIHKVEKETVQALLESFDITHFSPTSGPKVEGVKYNINVPTDELVNHLLSDTDYILLDYPFTDRLSGIILHAFSLEIPLIINKSYADVLGIPGKCYITYETADDIINNSRLYDQAYFSELKTMMREYKESMMRKCDNLFAIEPRKKAGLINHFHPQENKSHIWRKLYFRALWSSALSHELRFALSEGLFKGREAFIFAAGPSLRQVDMEALRGRLNQALVICIKQSIEMVGADCDAMVMNFCNFSGYDWEKIHCPVLWTTWNPSQPEVIRAEGARCNAAFEVKDNGTPNAETLAQTTAGHQDWSNLLRLPASEVPWGPGLMYEIAIPLALHAGVSHIHLVGWDIGTLNQTTDDKFDNEHFYNNAKIRMTTQITNLEIETVARSTKSLRVWLEGRGVGLSVVSDRSLVDESVTREMQWMRT